MRTNPSALEKGVEGTLLSRGFRRLRGGATSTFPLGASPSWIPLNVVEEALMSSVPINKLFSVSSFVERGEESETQV